MKEKIIKILKWFVKIWCVLIGLLVFIGAGGILVFEGWTKFTEVFSPFNIVNFLVILVLLLPAIGAYYLSERLEKTQLENMKKCNICGKEKPEKDFWIEMSIREISTQSHFAELAYQNIDPKVQKGTDAVFSSIHSFLSYCAMVSKLLESRDEKNEIIGDILKISETSIIHNRKFRNNLEHYDERLKSWIREKGVNANIGTYNVGPKSMIRIPNMVFVSHYDPTNTTFTFVNEDFNLSQLFEEVQRIKELADNWIKQVESGTINPPFV